MPNRRMRVSRCLLVTAILILGLTLGMTCKKKNQPPGAPSVPSGPVSGRKGDALYFSTSAEDPAGDSTAVRFDWGDGDTSGWSQIVRSGDSTSVGHSWRDLGTYSVRAQAKDAMEAASVWSGEHQLTVSSFSVTLGGLADDRGNSVQQISDGGYIAAGATYSYGAGNEDVWLVKTDSSGTILWDRTFGGTGYDKGFSVEQTSDGGYILAGATNSYGAGYNDVWLVKTDASGNKVWDKTFGGSNYDEGHSVQQTADGGYIVAGYTRSYGAGDADVWLIKTDESGNKVWDRTFGGTGWDRGFSVEQASDGGYIITGRTESYGAGYSDVWLIKTDTSGNKIWDRTFGGAYDDAGYSVQQTSDGGYVVTGSTESYGAGYSDVWLIKTDTSGNKIWDRTFGGAYDDAGYSVQQTSDGGYVVTGSTESGGAGVEDVWLVKTDASGNKVWDKTFGGNGRDEGYSVQQTSDGGYIFTGYACSNGAGPADLWLIKTDAEGN